jgi:hypothetical protein
MGRIADMFSSAFRAFNTDGVPASGPHYPSKTEIQLLGPALEGMGSAAAGVAVTVAYVDRASLYANLAPTDGQFGLVYADSDPTKTGLYRKSGATGTGSWVKTDIVLGPDVLVSIAGKVAKAGDSMTGELDMESNAVVANTDQTAARPSRWLHLFKDAAGSAVGWLRDGSIVGRGLLVPFVGTPERPRRFVAGLRDTWRLPIAVERSGKTALRLTPSALGLLADDLAATGWRGPDRGNFILPGLRFNRALMQDADKTIYGARQSMGGYRLGTAVAEAAGVHYVFGLGQSNRGGGSGNAGPPPFAQTPYPRHVLAFAKEDGSSYVDYYGNTAAENAVAGLPNALAPLFLSIDLAPASHDQAYGLSPTIMTSTAIEALARVNGGIGLPKITFAQWRGSIGADDFQPGDVYNLYENAIEGASRARHVADAYGLPVSRADIFFTQGENGPFTGYAALLEGLITSYTTGIQSALGLGTAPHFYFQQTNQSSSASEFASGVELDQRQVAIDNLGDGVTCVGPMYHLPLFNQGSTNIHADNLGRMMMGEMDALAARTVAAGSEFQPLGLNVAAVRTGAQVDINFSSMPGLAILHADTDWVPTVANLGFVAALASDGTALTINSAAVLDADTVRLTLSANPGAPVRIDYARDNNNAQTTWARGRGLIYVDSGVASPIAAAHGAPATIRHYCLRFRVTSAT